MRRCTARVSRLSLAIVPLAAVGLSACSSQESRTTGPGAIDAAIADPAGADAGTDARPTNTGDSVGAIASGKIVYGDDFYACEKTYEHYVVSSTLDQLGNVLRGMAHSP
jgi:hypothetical protein